ncbi:MAG TPA: hypothetical protein VKH82_04435 [Candidatus Binatia bacterium]|nr:hypothetical protein [Candidatus Binatia bacterium]
MASQPREPVRTDADGVRAIEISAAAKVIRVTMLAMGAVVLTVIGALVALRATAVERDDRPAPALDDGAGTAPGARRPVIIPAPGPTASAGATDTPASGGLHPSAARPLPRAARQVPDPPEKEDEPFTIGNPDDHTGMRVFPPMGTKPIKRGIVVPDDFDLPPGYVRHFQATDDGERLPAILMFSPDYDWVDAEGRPIAIPPDRVVPPEMAPPGLPIHMLDVPRSKEQPTMDPATAPDRRP